MLEDFQGDSWGSILPLRMSSLLPHDLCHERSASRRPPTEILHPIWLVSLREEETRETQRHTGKKATSWQRQRLEFCSHQPRNPRDCLQPPESIREACREQILLLNPQEGISPQFQTSGLQNCEKIQVFCSKPPGGTLKWLLEETNTETNTTRLVK